VDRCGATEFACSCGHSFVQRLDTGKIRHPWRCVLLGHWISFAVRRYDSSEYVCDFCGHPFLLEITSTPQQPEHRQVTAASQ
jgi:hypothetical protein